MHVKATKVLAKAARFILFFGLLTYLSISSCNKIDSQIGPAEKKVEELAIDHQQATCIDWYWVTWDAMGNIISRDINTECTGGGTMTFNEYAIPTGGGGGYFTANFAPREKNGINCKVFKYTPTASNWQECGVKNMKYTLKWIGSGFNVTLDVTLNQVVFGMPMVRADGTEYPPGYAAQLSAQAVSLAGSMVSQLLTKSLYRPTDNEIDSLYRHYMDLFMKNFSGTADRTGSRSPGIIFTEADYKLLGNGDCDDRNLN